MNETNFTNEQIEYIKNASDHVEILCGGMGCGKTHQLINEMQDRINNLQSKIDKINQYIKEAKESDSFTKLPSGKISDVGYCMDALEDIKDIIKEEVE
jgi:hypothetical protein